MATSIFNGVDDAAIKRHELSSKRILLDCCEQRAVCKLQPIPGDNGITARFNRYCGDEFELHLLQETTPGLLCTQAICCVSFPHGTSFCAFLCCLIEVRLAAIGERTVLATVPQNLTVTNLRQSFRVPVIDEAGLETTIRTSENQKVAVWTRDITEGGLEIELIGAEDLVLDVGSAVVVELKFRGEVLRRAAQVRRRNSTHCALSFVRHAGGDVNQAASMRSMVLSLQKLWLRSRLI